MALEDVYLADFPGYHLVTTGAHAPATSDFVVHFPTGSSIAAGGYVVVGLHSSAEFNGIYGFDPDFDFDDEDVAGPAMEGTIGSIASLTNDAEMVMLFYWDGMSDLVSDIDYLVFGDLSSTVDKTGLSSGGSAYLPDTAAGSQNPAIDPNSAGESLTRCNYGEPGQVNTGGNGVTGSDETSESFASSFSITTNPSPGAANTNCA